MSVFSTSLTPTPAAGKGVPFNWFTKLLDNTLALKQGDQALDYLRASQVLSIDTVAVNNYNPAGMTIEWNGSVDVVFNGLVPLGDGDIRIFHNVSSSKFISLQHESASSTAGNRFKLPAAAQIIGPNGSCGVKYDANISRWVMLFLNPGKALDVAYSAGNFGAAGGGTWTFPSGGVNQITFACQQHASMMDVSLGVTNTTISGTVGALTVVIPLGFVSAKTVAPQLIDLRVNGAFVTGLVSLTSGSGSIGIYRQDRGNFAPGTANCDVFFQARFQVT